MSDRTQKMLEEAGKAYPGEQVRSFQFAIERLRNRPELASLLIHKPGPLTDESPARQSALADLYRRGLNELSLLLAGVRARPS